MKVYQAINKVQKALAVIGITKSMRNTQGAGYNFRGIDQVYNALSPLLAEHGLCILPRVVKSEQTERPSSSGKALIYSYITMEFDLVSAEDGSKHTICTVGEAFDSGDKSMNKAMSAAYKYAAFQAFAIPTEGDNDADAHTYEAAPKPSGKVAQAFGLTEGKKAMIANQAISIENFMGNQCIEEAFNEYSTITDVEEKTHLWSLLDSKTRSTLKSYGQKK